MSQSTRTSELLGLRWEDIDLDTGIVDTQGRLPLEAPEGAGR
jgi:integrase